MKLVSCAILIFTHIFIEKILSNYVWETSSYYLADILLWYNIRIIIIR